MKLRIQLFVLILAIGLLPMGLNAQIKSKKLRSDIKSGKVKVITPDTPAKAKDKSKPIMAPMVTSINFRNEPLDSVVKSISKLTGKSFILTQDLSRKTVTIIAQEDVTIEEAYRAFLSALEMNDLTIVPVGKFLKIVRIRDVKTKSLDTYSGRYAPSSDAYITRIYHLKYIKAKDVSRALTSLVKPRSLIDYEPTNSLILTDTGANIQRLIDIIKHLDVKGFEERLEVIKIKYASANEIAKQLNNFYRVKTSTGRPPGRFTPPPLSGTVGGGGGEVISIIIPDPRTNSIIVKANEQGIEKLKELIAKLDLNVGGGTWQNTRSLSSKLSGQKYRIDSDDTDWWKIGR